MKRLFASRTTEGPTGGRTGVQASASNRLARRHGPVVVTLTTAILIAIAILPSALTLPQSNPNTVPEYAPVPPRDESAPPPAGGNISSLSLGTTQGLAQTDTLDALEGVVRKPTTKRCVGNPPRQTEDPMSPPCVAFFEGDNGGAIYQGVTRDEIRIVYYTNDGSGAANTRCDSQNQCDNGMPTGSYCDLDKPPNTDRGCMPYNSNRDHWAVRSARPLVRHFNSRFQTYGRHVHIWFFAAGLREGSVSQTEADTRSYAADNYQRIRPFSVMPISPTAYVDSMTSRGVLALGTGVFGQPNAFFKKYDGLVWGFGPDIEHWANGYVNYVCSKVKGTPVSHTDGTDTFGQPMKGQPRRYAFMHTTQATATGLHRFRDLARLGLRDCGITPETEVTFPVATSLTYAGGDGGSYGATNVAKLRQHNVNTILWFGGQESYTGQHADQQRYYPEIVIAGDGLIDGILNGTGQNQNWWRNVSGYSTALYQGDTLEGQPHFQACKDGDPNSSRADCASSGGHYRSFFMLFKAIQSAGPKITPASIDRGLHALPAIKSTHPMLAACYFDPGDYTCVKDGVEIWWDPNAQSAFWQGRGCFHMTRAANRFLPGTWPEGDETFKNPKDPCSPVLGGATVGVQNPSAPGG